MDIVIDIQGFCDVEENFISKEVAVIAINASITGLWRHFAHLTIYLRE